jgi:hypothetical protein
MIKMSDLMEIGQALQELELELIQVLIQIVNLAMLLKSNR